MLKIKKFELKKQKETILSIPEILLEDKYKNLVLGPNDKGKSALLNCIHSGECVEPFKNKEKRVPSVLIDYHDGLFNELSMWKNLCFGIPKLTETKKNLIKTLAEKVELDKYMSKKVAFLSFSNKKLVELIRATAIMPLLILIDDLDKYFDDINLIKAISILTFASNNGSIILASSGRKIFGFDKSFIIKNDNLCPEGEKSEA